MRLSSLLLCAVCLLVANSAYAANPASLSKNNARDNKASAQQCRTQVNACLTMTQAERSDCFHDAAVSEQCSSEELGKLIFRRWASAPSTPEGSENALGLLGSSMVDSDCLVNFDNQLSSELILGHPSNSALQSLGKKLDGCRKDSVEDMFLQ